MSKLYLKLSVMVLSVFILGAGCLSVGDTNQIQTSGPAGMFVSTDRGENWKAISTMPATDGIKNLNSISVYRLVEDPQDPEGIYWASREKGLFFSFDSGRSWEQSGEPFNNAFVKDIAVKPTDSCTIYATNGRQVFKTDDCVRSWVESWEEVRYQDSITSLAFDPFNPEHIYMAESNGDVLMSEDGGVHWAVVNRFDRAYIRDIIFDAHKEGLLYVTTKTKGLFRSKDGGKTWVSLEDKLSEYPGGLEYRRFFVYPSNSDQIYWISEYGVLVSKNAGDDWDPIELVTPPGSVDIYGFTVSPLNDQQIYYTATLDSRSTFYRTEDGGKTWETRKLPSKQIPTVLRAHPKNDEWLYLGFTIPPQQ